jgi:hypothetical protein
MNGNGNHNQWTGVEITIFKFLSMNGSGNHNQWMGVEITIFSGDRYQLHQGRFKSQNTTQSHPLWSHQVLNYHRTCLLSKTSNHIFQ